MLYTLKLVGLNADEIEFLALTMELKGIGMGDASKYVDNMPSVLFEEIDADTAKKYKAMYEEVGAIIEVGHAGEAAPESIVAPEPISIEMPTPVFASQALAEVAEEAAEVTTAATPVVEIEQPKSESIVSITPVVEETPEPETEEVSESEPAPANNSVFQINNTPAAETPAEEEAPKYDFYGSCPKCGSTFVTVKKSSGIFGTKIKCVCDACKHKF